MLNFGDTVLDERSLDDLLQRVVVLASHTVPSAHSVSITVADPSGFRTSNASQDEALVVDLAQYAGDDGPCLRSCRSASQVQVAVGAESERWPEFHAKATELGVTAVLSTPLVRSSGDAIGALNVYAHDTGGFPDEAAGMASLIGEHAMILLGKVLELRGATQLNEQLREALASREIIGEAKGIIMERQNCTRDEAFNILRRASQRENRKLRDLAEELVTRVEARSTGQPAK